MRSPFTGVVFALEITHDVNALLPLLIAVTLAHAFTVLVLRRSILTEKVSRRGYHLSREYAIDPLEILFVREVVRRNAVAAPCKIAGGGCVTEVNAETTPLASAPSQRCRCRLPRERASRCGDRAGWRTT